MGFKADVERRALTEKESRLQRAVIDVVYMGMETSRGVGPRKWADRDLAAGRVSYTTPAGLSHRGPVRSIDRAARGRSCKEVADFYQQLHIFTRIG